MLGGKSLANDTSHCGQSLAVDACLLLKYSTPQLKADLVLLGATW